MYDQDQTNPVRKIQQPNEYNLPGGEEESHGGGMEFEKHCCFSTFCSTVRRLAQGAGLILAVLNCGLDIVYAAKSIYFTKLLYILCILFIILKAGFALLIGQVYFYQFVT